MGLHAVSSSEARLFQKLDVFRDPVWDYGSGTRFGFLLTLLIPVGVFVYVGVYVWYEVYIVDPSVETGMIDYCTSHISVTIDELTV